MNYLPLGKSGLKVSQVSFGCMSLGDDHGVNKKLLRKAFEDGINYFDTADLYQKGFNEETVGNAFAGMREQVIIATKVGNQLRNDGSGWDWNPTKAYILQAVEKSLTRLRTDYIDVYQLHGGTKDDPIDETIEAFELLKQQGKIRHYGISSIRPNVIREYVKRSGIVSVMMQYSLLDRRPEESCFPLLLENHIGVLARGSLASGLLIDKPHKPYLSYSEKEVARAAEAITNVSREPRTKTDASLGFVLHHPAVTSAVVGMRTEAQLAQAIQATKQKPLDNDEMEILRDAVTINVYDQHR